MKMEKYIVRACWEDGKPLHIYGRVVRGELVKENDDEFSVKTKKDGTITYLKKGGTHYRIIKKVIYED